MKPAALLLAVVPLAIGAPIPNADAAQPAARGYTSYGDYKGATYTTYGTYQGAGSGSTTTPSKYTSYGTYPKPAGGYGSYPKPAGGYGSYNYKRVVDWVKSIFSGSS